LRGELGSADEQLGGGMLLLGRTGSLFLRSGEPPPIERLPLRALPGALSLCWAWPLSGVQEDVWGIKRAVATSSEAMCPCGIAKSGTAIPGPGEAARDDVCTPGEIFVAILTWLWLFAGGDPTGTTAEPAFEMEELEMRVGVGAWAIR